MCLTLTVTACTVNFLNLEICAHFHAGLSKHSGNNANEITTVFQRPDNEKKCQQTA